MHKCVIINVSVFTWSNTASNVRILHFSVSVGKRDRNKRDIYLTLIIYDNVLYRCSFCFAHIRNMIFNIL